MTPWEQLFRVPWGGFAACSFGWSARTGPENRTGVLPVTRRLNRDSTRCHRPSEVRVEDERGLVAAACVDHLEWAFLTGVDAWTGRWRTT